MINNVVSVLFRGVAQLVARLLWEQDAAGSSPVTSTIKTHIPNAENRLECVFFFLFALILCFYLYCLSAFDIRL